MSSTNILQWLSLVGAIWLQSINGTNTNFPAYSSQLKNLLSISQFQLNNLAFASDAGKLFGFLPGLAAVYLPLWLVLSIGGTLGFVGYGLQYLLVTDQIHISSSFSYWYVFLLTVMAGNSICWINTVCYVVTIKNFPLEFRQVAVGITASYLGLSAKIYTDVVNVIHDNTHNSSNKNAKLYLLLNSIIPLLVCLTTLPMVRQINFYEISRRMRGGFIFMFVVTIATGIYAIVGSFDSLSRNLSPIVNVIGMGVLLLIAPSMIPLVEKIRQVLLGKWRLNGEPKVHDSAMEANFGVERMENGVKDAREIDDDSEIKVGVMEEIGVKMMVKRLDFWLYFMVYFSGATLGLVFLNNLGQIAESRGCSGTSSLVSLSSSFGFFGRLLPSLLDYFFSRSEYMISRPASIVALMAPMAASFLLLLNTTNLALYVSTAIIGVCTGAITSISVATTTELFGTKNFSVNHNVVVSNIPMGSFIYGYLAAHFYHKEAASNGGGKCIGMDCYRTTFVLWGCVCSFGTFLAFVLYSRTKKFYSQRLQFLESSTRQSHIRPVNDEECV